MRTALAWSRTNSNDFLICHPVIQFGFVTIFVVAFPLAPLFALLNNIFEMRLDAQKFLKYYRRPVPCRVKDIGVWFNIMAILSRISTASSAFIIAFSSNFIPRLVYTMSERKHENNTEDGYLNYTLSYFATKDFGDLAPAASAEFGNVTLCRYAEFRNPHTDVEHAYKRNMTYWHILAARLAFLVLFEVSAFHEVHDMNNHTCACHRTSWVSSRCSSPGPFRTCRANSPTRSSARSI